MPELFNGIVETSTRLLVLMSEFKDRQWSTERLSTYDYMVINSRYFKIDAGALHGENEFSLCEFSIRRKKVVEALKYMIERGLVYVGFSPQGFAYTVSGDGALVAKRLQSSYAQKIRQIARTIDDLYGDFNGQDLIDMIDQVIKAESRR